MNSAQDWIANPSPDFSATSPPLAVLALNRMGFGPRPGDIAVFNNLGSTEEKRLQQYVELQLEPQNINDDALQGRITTAGFQTLNKSLTQLWADYYLNSGGDYNIRILPWRETERLTFLKAVYSRRQLAEVMADFWHNHFNVYVFDNWVPSIFMHHDRDIIRTHSLGNFRELLEAVTSSTAMLTYLDNYTNSNAGPNENHAREMFEIHTMGSQHYLGVGRQDDVPPGPDGRPVGYVDDDVYEAARCFTGWTFRNKANDPQIGSTGEFMYRADWHDRFQKHVLGEFIPPDQADMVDGRMVLDLLAYHAGTAQNIAFKLCRRFINDDPPPSIVNSTADLFYAQRNSPTQIKEVLRHILNSAEFRNSWGGKTKRPFEVIASALRASNADFTFKIEDGQSDSFFWLYDRIGQPLYRHRAPDGYGDTKEDWLNTSTMVYRWRIINWLTILQREDETLRIDVMGQTPAHVRSAVELADFWIYRLLGRSIDSGERQHIIDFMAQGHHPDHDLPLDSDSSVQERLSSMVGLILLSPEFQWR